jgi:acetyl-CoA C-acetyltransferase
MAGREVVIVGAARTPIGSFLGSLASVTAPKLGAIAIRAALERAGVEPGAVDEVVMGNVLQAGIGQAPARQAAIFAGLPEKTPCWTLNKVCGSGLKAVISGAQAIALGEAEIVVAGGMESMSNVPYYDRSARTGARMGNVELVDGMIHDGLWDVYNHQHMGMCAEACATSHGISRSAQDEYAIESTRRAIEASKAGAFKPEIVPVEIEGKKGDKTYVTDDEGPMNARPDKIPSLRPVFKKDGTVTAGNASGLNDGAAAVVVMTAQRAQQLGLTPLARIASYATVALDPAIMGMGPVPASRKALERAGWKPQDLDLLEINEAFAAQACAVNNEMGWDTSKVNVNGGAIAIGHPIGASGCRILVTLLHEMGKRNAKKGIASLCIGGGMGVALCVER